MTALALIKRHRLTTLYTLWLSCVAMVTGALLNPSLLGTELDKITRESVGVNSMQSHLDNIEFNAVNVDISEKLAQLSDSLSQKFRSRIKITEDLTRTIQGEFANLNPNNDVEQCCTISIEERNEQFKQGVDFNKLCMRVSGSAAAPDTRTYLNEAILNKMKKNLQDYPTLKWQYFGSENGVFTKYPASYDAGCDEYDNRFRPWYAEAVVPASKDVIIVIDKSGSMGTTLMDTAKRAANTVLETMNPNDRVGVVAFSSEATILDGNLESKFCFGSQLALATPQNIAIITRDVNEIVADGGTSYVQALDKAFSLLHKIDRETKGNSTKRDKVILFLTDGVPTEGTDANGRRIILNKIRDENAKIRNEVVIMTYGIGGAAENAGAEAILQDMAEQKNYDSAYGEIRKGLFTKVSDPDTLRGKMSSYYDFFSDVEHDNAIITVPYVDASGLGLVTSICLPVFYNANLKGVACVDITMEDLLADVIYFRTGEKSYAFIIDKTGRTMMHPLLPKPYSISDAPIFVPIESLERTAEENGILTSMKNGTKGSMKISNTMVFPRGSTSMDGVYTESVQSTYMWQPINGTDFSVCIVMPDDDVQNAMTTQPKISSQDFKYHRIDKVPSSSLCKNIKAPALKGSPSIFFAAKSFKKPFVYLDGVETQNEIDQIVGYMTDITNNIPGFKDDIRNTVSALVETKNIWTQDVQSIWHYVGTENGIMKLFPGALNNKTYDPTVRPWYKRAVSNRGKITLNAPYDDALGLGYVITLSHTLYDGKSGGNHNENDPIFGVMGFDFNFMIFYNKLTALYPICAEDDYSCFVIDSSGFVVMHKDFVSCSNENQQIEGLHITVKEPSIATHMINNNYMRRQKCINFESIEDHYTWLMNRGSIGNNGIDMIDSVPAYELHAIDSTNAFVGIKKNSALGLEQCKCSATNQGQSGSDYSCTNEGDKFCECPCFGQADFDYCTNTFPLGSDGSPTCTPDPPPFELKTLIEESVVNSLDLCVQLFSCVQQFSQNDCLQSGTCTWCKNPNNATQGLCMESKCSGGNDACYGLFAPQGPGDGGDGNGDGDGDGDGNEEGNNQTGVIVGVVVAVILIVAAIIVGVCLYRRKQRGKKNNAHEMVDNTVNSNRQASNRQAMSPYRAPSIPTEDTLPPAFGEAPSRPGSVALAPGQSTTNIYHEVNFQPRPGQVNPYGITNLANADFDTYT
ncbi:unnamed protein product, partial [Owenia fusiformis]